MHMSDVLRADDEKVDLYMSSSYLTRTMEERRFLCGLSHRFCIPEAEMVLVQAEVDELCDDAEVSRKRSILYAWVFRHWCGAI